MQIRDSHPLINEFSVLEVFSKRLPIQTEPAHCTNLIMNLLLKYSGRHELKMKRNKCPILTFSRSSSSGQKRIEKEREREWGKGIDTSIRGTPSVLKGLPLSKSVTPVQPVADTLKPVTTSVQPVADALDEDTICRKAGTIVDELTQNRDFKVRELTFSLSAFPYSLPLLSMSFPLPFHW